MAALGGPGAVGGLTAPQRSARPTRPAATTTAVPPEVAASHTGATFRVDRGASSPSAERRHALTGMAPDAHPADARQADAQEIQAHEVQAELEAAREAVFEHRRLTGRLEAARSALAAAEAGLAQATEALADESADVRRLEDFSPTLIRATLRGDRDERLETERAEQRAAEYRVAAARRAVAGAERESAVVAADLDRLGDVAARRGRALAGKEAWVLAQGGDGAGELTGLAAEVGTARGGADRGAGGRRGGAGALETRLADLGARRERLLTSV